MISDFILLYQMTRVVSIILSVAIAYLVLRKKSDYILNKLIAASFILFAIGFSIDLLLIFISSTLQQNSSYIMALIVLVITTAIYLIFLVAFSLLKGEESIKNVKFLVFTYGPFLLLWLLTLSMNAFNFKAYVENTITYWLFDPNPLGGMVVILPTTIYLLFADFYLFRLYRVSPPEVKGMLKHFTFGVTFAVIFGLVISLFAIILSQNSEIQFIGQTFRPIGIAIGGIFIALSFLESGENQSDSHAEHPQHAVN